MSGRIALPAYYCAAHPFRCAHCGSMVPVIGLVTTAWHDWAQWCRACLEADGADVSSPLWEEIGDMARAPHEVAVPRETTTSGRVG